MRVAHAILILLPSENEPCYTFSMSDLGTGEQDRREGGGDPSRGGGVFANGPTGSQGRGSAAYPEADYARPEGDYSNGGGSGGGQGFGVSDEMNVIEPPQFSFFEEHPDVVSIVIAAYATDGTPAPLGPGLNVYCTMSDIVRAYPNAMPRPGEGERRFLAIPINSAGKQLHTLQQRFVIPEAHAAVVALNTARSKGGAPVKPGGDGVTDRLLALLETQILSDQAEKADLRKALREALETSASERVSAANGLQGQLSSGYTTLLEKSNEISTKGQEALVSTLQSAADRERERSDAWVQKMETERKAEAERHEREMARLEKEAELKLKAQAQAHTESLERMKLEAAERRRDEEARQDRQAALEAKMEAERLRLESQRASEHEQSLNRIELGRQATEVRQAEIAAEERQRVRDDVAARLKAIEGGHQSPLTLLTGTLAALAPFGLTTEGIGNLVKRAFTNVTEGGGGGIGTAIVTGLMTIGEKLVDVAKVGAEAQLEAARGGRVDDEEEDDEEEIEEAPEAPAPGARPRPATPPGRAPTPTPDPLPVDPPPAAAPSGTPRTAAPVGVGGVPPAPQAPRPAPAPSPPLADPEAELRRQRLAALHSDQLRQARTLLGELVQQLEDTPQPQWLPLLVPLLATHGAVVEPYLAAIGLRKALSDAGASEDLARDVINLAASMGAVPRNLL